MIFSPIIYYLEYLFQLFARPNYPFMLTKTKLSKPREKGI